MRKMLGVVRYYSNITFLVRICHCIERDWNVSFKWEQSFWTIILNNNVNFYFHSIDGITRHLLGSFSQASSLAPVTHNSLSLAINWEITLYLEFVFYFDLLRLKKGLHVISQQLYMLFSVLKFSTIFFPGIASRMVFGFFHWLFKVTYLT